jgi:hypothetical protein
VSTTTTNGRRTDEKRTDAKAGFCQWCRQGDHGVCASPTCTCTQVRHALRPKSGDDPLADVRARAQGNGGGSASPPRVIPRERAGKAKPAAAVWELVKADPPAPAPKKQRNVELARPLLEQIMAEGDRAWHRLAVFPSSMGASQTCGRLRKAYPREWEWRAVKVAEVGQSALYVRWLGEKAGVL